MAKQRVLITGGSGFLGSHLCDRFIKEGFHVIAMDNLITGDLRNIEHLFKLPDFEFYHHDVSTFVHVPGELHYILHFASPASPIDYLKIPIQTLKVSSLGTHNLLGLARAKNKTSGVTTNQKLGLGYVYPMSKRTSLEATYGRDSKAVSAGDKTKKAGGIDLTLHHNF